MKRHSLLADSVYANDPVRFREDLIRSVASSTAIETDESVESIAADLREFLDQGSPPLKSRQRR